MIYHNRIDRNCANIVERVAIKNDIPIPPFSQISAACVDPVGTFDIAVYRLENIALNRQSLDKMPRAIRGHNQP